MVFSSETSTQRQRILMYLQTHRTMTTHQARTELDIFHPAARVQELREAGNEIVTYRRNVSTDKGSHKAVAEYILMSANHGEMQ